VDNFYWIEEIKSEQSVWVGEQALHLSQLARKGYSVMPNFVISAQALREFLASIHQEDPFFADLAEASLRLNVEDAEQLQAIARQIRQTFQATPLPQAWIKALEPCLKLLPTIPPKSAEASQAVILRPSFAVSPISAKRNFGENGSAKSSLLDLTNLIEPQVCRRTVDSIVSGLKQLWAELFRARNLVYLQRAKLSLQDLHFAVIVQPIGSAETSGYLQANSTDWEILATCGLPMSIERGEVLPDVYHLNLARETVASQALGNQTIVYQISDSDSPLERHPWNHSQQLVLQPQDLQRFLRLAQQLQTEFGMAIALEWQFYQDALYVTQVQYCKPDQDTDAKSELPQSVIAVGVGASGGRTIARAEVLTNSDHLPLTLPPETVLVASEISPDWLPLMQQATAIVSEQGGLTSHGAIVARELGIPAIVGAGQATQQIRTGDWVVVDGDEGKVYDAQTEKLKPRDAVSASPLTPTMNVPIATRLLVALSQPDLVERAAQLPVDGVGLLRSELMMVSILDQHHPQHWIRQNRQSELIKRLAQQIEKFAQAFSPRPVFYRSLDLRSHEFQSLRGQEPISEPNPMLGLRGTFSYVLNPELFDLELEALEQAMSAKHNEGTATGYSNLRLVLPFVRTVEEFSFCRSRVEQAGLMQHAQFQLWIMAEVPSVIFLLPELVKAGVQGICIGTSDLTQLILGVDRDQGVLATRFDETHPAVMNAIAQLIQSARALKIPCSICGRIPTHTDFIDQLVEWGIPSITTNLDSVEATYSAIARAEQRLLLKNARNS
jgi:pyruvate,water dikinase